MLAGSGFHSLFIDENGVLSTWGYNGKGELGLANREDQNKPTRIGKDNNWLKVVTSGRHTLGIKAWLGKQKKSKPECVNGMRHSEQPYKLSEILREVLNGWLKAA